MTILINHLGGKCRQCHVFFTEMAHFDRQRAVVIENEVDSEGEKHTTETNKARESKDDHERK